MNDNEMVTEGFGIREPGISSCATSNIATQCMLHYVALVTLTVALRVGALLVRAQTVLALGLDRLGNHGLLSRKGDGQIIVTKKTEGDNTYTTLASS